MLARSLRSQGGNSSREREAQDVKEVPGFILGDWTLERMIRQEVPASVWTRVCHFCQPKPGQGPNGMERRRWPVPWKMALAMAGGVVNVATSPAPPGGLIGIIDERDVDRRNVLEVQNGIAAPVDAGDLRRIEVDLLQHGPTRGLDHVAFDLVFQSVRVDDQPAVVRHAIRLRTMPPDLESTDTSAEKRVAGLVADPTSPLVPAWLVWDERR